MLDNQVQEPKRLLQSHHLDPSGASVNLSVVVASQGSRLLTGQESPGKQLRATLHARLKKARFAALAK